MEKSNKRKPIPFVLLLIVIVGAVWVLFLNPSSDPTSKASDTLVGEWMRTDGVYSIRITDIERDGVMEAAYFNPGPIHVGKSAWSVEDDVLQVYIELQDENYPGSKYQLYYDEDSGKLKGTYYQAVARETYKVEFTSKK